MKKLLAEEEIKNQLEWCGLKQIDANKYSIDEKLVFEANEWVGISFRVVERDYFGTLKIEFYPCDEFMEAVSLLLYKYIPDDMLFKPKISSPGWVRFLLWNDFRFNNKITPKKNPCLQMESESSTGRYKGKGDQTCDQTCCVEFQETNMNTPTSVTCCLKCKVNESPSGLPFYAHLSLEIISFSNKNPMKTFDNLEFYINWTRKLVLKSASKIDFSGGSRCKINSFREPI